MKNLVLSLLVLVMFMPGLACARFMGAADSHMAPPAAEQTESHHCPPQKQVDPGSSTMLFKDCAKVDLQHADGGPLLKKPELAKVFLPYALLAGFTVVPEIPQAGLVIRGPPPDPAAVSASYPPVFLSTLRLRI